MVGRSKTPWSVLTFLVSVLVTWSMPLWADAQLSAKPIVLHDFIQKRAIALRDRALEESQAYNLVKSVTMEVGPRSAGSSGDKAAVSWALRKFKELGFTNIRAEPVTVPHWDRGTTVMEILSPYPQRLVATAIGGSIGTAEAGIEAPVLAVSTLDELKALSESAATGKIVYINERMERTRDATGYIAAVQKRGFGPSEAAKKGAVALVIRSAGTSTDRFAHTGAKKKLPEIRSIPSVALANADADILDAQLASGKTVSLRIRMTARHLPDELSANVIGEIRGRERPDEIVLLGAHLDSWDLGTGALDDGAGIAIVMEAAHLIGQMRPRPQRTIRVVLYANEEFGLSGAYEYADKYAESLIDHVLALEADLGADPVFLLESRVAENALPQVNAMYALLQPLGIELGGNSAFGGADISTIRDQGVPVLGPRQDTSRYFDYHHTLNDTLDKVNHKGIRQNTAVYAVLAYLAAEIDEGFGRIPIVESATE